MATAPQGADTGRPVGELTYTEASRELDAIVAFFEERDVDVDQLVARLERATEIVSELDQRLRRTRVQVDQLVPKLAAVLSEVPADDVDADDVDADDDDRTAPSGRGTGTEPPGLF